FTDAVNIQVDTLESFTGKSASKPRMRNHFAVGCFNARLDDKNVQRTEKIRTAFNAPLLPFVLATTSIGQEGLDFHLYCRKVFHWNLPSNPVDLEQREGRVNRYMGLAIRQSIANKYGTIPFKKDVWQEMMGQASLKENGIIPTLSPTGVSQTIAVTM
ncbi:MAG: helicase, partial [Candidatus Hydrogenedens sp.]|nr:helicase [Candidatus Hydrogenedens sp.]